MRILSRVAAGVAAAVLATSVYAGNIALTGHDDDFHAFFHDVGNPGAQLSAMVSFARNGSTNPGLPVLIFDHNGSGFGLELDTVLTTLLIPHVTFDAELAAIPTSFFNPAVYSAFVVASDITCSGCDNGPNTIAHLTADAAAIAAFLDAGGGIVALSGAARASTYYGFLPNSASGFGSPPSTPYFQTLFGGSVGIPAVNGDPTHNFFSEPGTGGVSSAYGVVERLNNAVTGTPETLACVGCTSASLAAPEPASLALVGVGLAALGFGRRRNKNA